MFGCNPMCAQVMFEDSTLYFVPGVAEVPELQQDAGLWSVWKSSGRDGILAAHAVGPSPTWWSWDGDIVTCLV